MPKGGRTVWFAVGGSDHGPGRGAAAQDRALAHPARLLRAEGRRATRGRRATPRSACPATGCSSAASQWSKQNLAESVQESRDLKVRPTNGGTEYPPPWARCRRRAGTAPASPTIRGCSRPTASTPASPRSASGQFGTIKDHLRALRDVSVVANGAERQGRARGDPGRPGLLRGQRRRGQHRRDREVPHRSSRWCGAGPATTAFRDEMYPFAVRNMRYIFRELDADGDGWPEGLGNVERPGMGEEKLDNTVYTIRGLRDLADLATSKGDTATRTVGDRARRRPASSGSTAAWWNGSDTQQYADSLDDPGNDQVFQRHWIGVTPAEVELKRPGNDPTVRWRRSRTRAHWSRSARRPATPASSGSSTPAPGPPRPTGGNTGAVLRQRDVLGAVRAVGVHAEHLDHGRRGGGARPDGRRPAAALHDRQRPRAARPERVGAARCHAGDRALARLRQQHRAGCSPSGRWRCRRGAPTGSCGRSCTTSSASPPTSVATGQRGAAGADRPGSRLRPAHPAGRRCGGRDGLPRRERLRTVVRQSRRWRLTIGAVLPAGSRVDSVRLDGHRAVYRVLSTARGRVLVTNGGRGVGTTNLVVRLR